MFVCGVATPSSACRHLLPGGEKGMWQRRILPPFSPRGDGARRADEGAGAAVPVNRAARASSVSASRALRPGR
ncbi:hypothetical protein B5M44_20375 [Shinella sumterensis]|nr:hypothetical protein B5M44_20375 [Shinella sumterensis]